MKVTRKSLLSGKVHTMEIPVDAVRLKFYETSRTTFVQEVFPELSVEHREFIKTGITPEEWAALPSEDEEEPL